MKQNKTTIFLISTNIFIIVLIGAYFLVGTVISSRQSQKIEQSWKRLVTKFPNLPHNASASELENLVTKLDVVGDSSRSGKTDKNSERVISDLKYYLNHRPNQSDDQANLPSDLLKKYLESNSSTISEIRNHLIKNEAPSWNRKQISRFIYINDTPFSHDTLQDSLLAEILEQTRSKNPEVASQTLQAYWNLNKYDASLGAYGYPNYFEDRILRRIELPPSEWRKYLILEDDWTDYLERSSFYISLYFRLGLSTGCRNLVSSKNGEDISECQADFFDSFERTILHPLLEPYRLIIAANNLERDEQAYPKISREDICSLPAEELSQKLIQKFKTNSFWLDNFSASVQSEQHILYYFYGRLIERELTQKVLQIREVSAKSETIPISIPGIENSWTCPHLKWNYKVVDRKVTISLNGQPGWASSRPMRRYYYDPERYSYSFQLDK
jgi:hypothetical protein